MESRKYKNSSELWKKIEKDLRIDKDKLFSFMSDMSNKPFSLELFVFHAIDMLYELTYTISILSKGNNTQRAAGIILRTLIEHSVNIVWILKDPETREERLNQYNIKNEFRGGAMRAC